MLSIIPKLRLIGTGVAMAVLLSAGAYQIGKREGKSEIRADAAIEAIKRVQQSERDNAAFKNLSAQHQCIVFMRDSGLPTDGC